MKKSFAENCIRYISTATALILALAMLCCANFSAGAKTLGSNLTITDTTSLLEDINTTTNTTPAKTKDLIASGAGVEILSTGAYTRTIYVDVGDTGWTSVKMYYYTKVSNKWPGDDMTSLGNGLFKIDLNLTDRPGNCIFNNGNSGNDNQTVNLNFPTNDNNLCTVNKQKTNKCSGTWTEYSATTTYTVTFHANGHGTAPSAQTVIENGSATEPTPAPTATGYTFGGWYNESTCDNLYDFTTAVTGDLTLYAKWTANQYTVSFNSNGGNVTPESITVTYDRTYGTLPSAGTKTGYTFAGWYTSASGGTQVKSTDIVKITSDTTLYAHWTANTYNITYKSGSDTLSGLNPTTYTYGVGATLPTDVTKDGYTFEGWYDNKDLTGDPVTSISTDATEDKTFFAKWEANKYQITYMSGNETLSGLKPSKYTYGEGVGTLPTPTKNGYRFVGWYENSTLAGTAVTSISDNATGAKTLYAKWIQKYIYLDVSELKWFYSNGCEGVVFFNTENVGDTTTGYTVMTELFTDTSGYETNTDTGKTPHSKLLYVKVPDDITDITKITFARHGSGDYDENYNITNITSGAFSNKNCFKITGGGNKNQSVTGVWSEETYTPVPINFTVGANGNVYLINNKNVDMPVSSGTIYADKSATSLKIKATPDAENRYELNTLKVNGVDKAGEISDKSAGGTVAIGTLGEENDVKVSFTALAKPKVTIYTVTNSKVNLTYLNEDGTSSTTIENASGECEVPYNTTITLNIIPEAGYYVSSVSGVTATVPASGTITATKEQVKDNLTVSYELAENPTVTIECYDTSGTELAIGPDVKITIGEEATNSKKVEYDASNETVFVANVTTENSYQFIGFYTQAPTEENPLQEANKITTSESAVTGCKASATNNNLTVKNVTSDVTLYAIFSQQYRVTFKYTNLTNFTVDGTAVATEGSVYVSAGANLNLVATLSDDYKLTKDYWSITPPGVGTFAPNGTNASYTVGTSDVEITITPQIATYTGEGKWGSKILKIDTSGVKKDTPWFAVAFKKSATDTDNYFIRCSKVSDDLYECVIPDGYTHFDIYRMAKDAKEFTTQVEQTANKLDSTIAWNVTNTTTKIGTKTSYKLSFVANKITQISISEK